MRVSTSQMYYSGTSNIINGQSDLYRTQNQLSTGRKNLTPRDNPVEATQAMMTTQSKEVNATFLKNQGTASDHLSFLDTQLNSVTDTLKSALEIAIQGGNSTYGPQDKLALAEHLKRNLESMVGLANTRDGLGEYVFAGNQTNKQPFAVSGSAPDPATGHYSLAAGKQSVSYSGDDSQRMLQVETSQTVATSASGQAVFMRVMDSSGKLNGGSVFDAMQNMINNLSGTLPKPDYNTALQGLQDSLDHVSRIRATTGASINLVDSLTSAGGDLAVQYDTQLAKLEGLDYAEAISRLNQQQMQLQAAQQSFSKTSQLSLFSYL